jgi:uncharacterized protein (DUF427 family)
MEKKGAILISFLGLVLFALAFGTLTHAALPAAISVSPSNIEELSPSDSFTIEINIDPEGAEIYGAQYDLYFDHNILNATSQSQGTFLSQDGATTAVFANRVNNSIGKIEYGEALMGAEHGVINPGTLATIKFDVTSGGMTTLKLSNVILGDSNATVIQSVVINGRVEVESTEFDTGPSEQPYPAISGMHYGTITPNVTVHNLSWLYTYPCPGSGGHTAYVAFYHQNNTQITKGRWDGYSGDWHNISFPAFTMFKNHTYCYEIDTGSYPRIHHTHELGAEQGMGIINCTSFVDANGNSYHNRIPAIRLEGGLL